MIELFIIDLLAIFSVYLVIDVSLNLEFGYTGIPNFGKVLAVASGAFVAGFFPGRLMALLLGLDLGKYVERNAEIVGIVTYNLGNNAPLAISLAISTLVLAALAGAFSGFVAAYPAIRLREDFLAIVLLVMGEGIRIIGQNYPPLVGGTIGVSVPDFFIWAGGKRFTIATLVILVIAILVLLYAEVLVRSPLGRVLRAIRDSEDSAASLGKDITHFRIRTLMVGSALGAVGGALYAFYTCSVVAVAYTRIDWTFWPWVAVTLGGIANNMGVVIGTFLFVAVRRLITIYKGVLAPFVPFDVVWLDMLLLGLLLILILMFKPGGIVPEKPTRTISPKKIRELLKRVE